MFNIFGKFKTAKPSDVLAMEELGSDSEQGKNWFKLLGVALLVAAGAGIGAGLFFTLGWPVLVASVGTIASYAIVSGIGAVGALVALTTVNWLSKQARRFFSRGADLSKETTDNKTFATVTAEGDIFYDVKLSPKLVATHVNVASNSSVFSGVRKLLTNSWLIVPQKSFHHPYGGDPVVLDPDEDTAKNRMRY